MQQLLLDAHHHLEGIDVSADQVHNLVVMQLCYHSEASLSKVLGAQSTFVHELCAIAYLKSMHYTNIVVQTE